MINQTFNYLPLEPKYYITFVLVSKQYPQFIVAWNPDPYPYYSDEISDWLMNDCEWDYIAVSDIYEGRFSRIIFAETGGALEFKLRFD